MFYLCLPNTKFNLPSLSIGNKQSFKTLTIHNNIVILFLNLWLLVMKKNCILKQTQTYFKTNYNFTSQRFFKNCTPNFLSQCPSHRNISMLQFRCCFYQIQCIQIQVYLLDFLPFTGLCILSTVLNVLLFVNQ